jgi:hypothetical protein
MKKKPFSIIAAICFTSICFLTATPERLKRKPAIHRYTGADFKINELVKPVKEQIENMLNKDETGNYKAYQEEIKK